jgi:hypothetical protein
MANDDFGICDTNGSTDFTDLTDLYGFFLQKIRTNLLNP